MSIDVAEPRLFGACLCLDLVWNITGKADHGYQGQLEVLLVSP